MERNDNKFRTPIKKNKKFTKTEKKNSRNIGREKVRQEYLQTELAVLRRLEARVGPSVVYLLNLAGYAHANNKRALHSWAIRAAMNMTYFQPDIVDNPKWDFQFALASVWPHVRHFALEGGLKDEWPQVKALELKGEKFVLKLQPLLQATGNWKQKVSVTNTYEASEVESMKEAIALMEEKVIIQNAAIQGIEKAVENAQKVANITRESLHDTNGFIKGVKQLTVKLAVQQKEDRKFVESMASSHHLNMPLKQVKTMIALHENTPPPPAKQTGQRPTPAPSKCPHCFPPNVSAPKDNCCCHNKNNTNNNN